MSLYKVYIVPSAFREAKTLPGNIRQRVKRAIDALSADPRPSRSKTLRLAGIDRELRRLRIENWRILYTINEEDQTIDILAVRKLPPYDYGDLQTLLQETK